MRYAEFSKCSAYILGSGGDTGDRLDHRKRQHCKQSSQTPREFHIVCIGFHTAQQTGNALFVFGFQYTVTPLVHISIPQKNSPVKAKQVDFASIATSFRRLLYFCLTLYTPNILQDVYMSKKMFWEQTGEGGGKMIHYDTQQLSQGAKNRPSTLSEPLFQQQATNKSISGLSSTPSNSSVKSLCT